MSELTEKLHQPRFTILFGGVSANSINAPRVWVVAQPIYAGDVTNLNVKRRRHVVHPLHVTGKCIVLVSVAMLVLVHFQEDVPVPCPNYKIDIATCLGGIEAFEVNLLLAFEVSGWWHPLRMKPFLPVVEVQRETDAFLLLFLPRVVHPPMMTSIMLRQIIRLCKCGTARLHVARVRLLSRVCAFVYRQMSGACKCVAAPFKVAHVRLLSRVFAFVYRQTTGVCKPDTAPFKVAHVRLMTSVFAFVYRQMTGVCKPDTARLHVARVRLLSRVFAFVYRQITGACKPDTAPFKVARVRLLSRVCAFVYRQITGPCEFDAAPFKVAHKWLMTSVFALVYRQITGLCEFGTAMPLSHPTILYPLLAYRTCIHSDRRKKMCTTENVTASILSMLSTNEFGNRTDRKGVCLLTFGLLPANCAPSLSIILHDFGFLRCFSVLRFF